MEIIKIYNLKTAKQTIELDLQGKIKLDIYESLENAFSQNSKKIFDLLIITYYKSIDFNREINENTVFECVLLIKSKHLNVILKNIEINLYDIEHLIHHASYRNFKIILKIWKQMEINLTIYTIFKNICEKRSLKFVKLFLSFLYTLNNRNEAKMELLIHKDVFGKSALDYASSNSLNMIIYLTKMLKYFYSNDLKNIRFDESVETDFLPNINLLIEAKNKDIAKYLMENYSFDLNEEDVDGDLIMNCMKDLDIIKMLFKYDGNVYVEIKNLDTIEKYRLLIKYINSNNILNNILFEDPEIFKLLKLKI